MSQALPGTLAQMRMPLSHERGPHGDLKRASLDEGAEGRVGGIAALSGQAGQRHRRLERLHSRRSHTWTPVR